MRSGLCLKAWTDLDSSLKEIPTQAQTYHCYMMLRYPCCQAQVSCWHLFGREAAKSCETGGKSRGQFQCTRTHFDHPKTHYTLDAHTHTHTLSHTHTHLILNRKFVKGQWFWQLEADPFLSGKDGGEVGSKAGRSTGGKNGSTGRVEGGVMQMGWWAKFQLIVQSPLWVSRHDMLWAKMYSFICNVVSKDVHWFKHLIASKLSCCITCYIHNIGLIEMLVFIFEHYSRYVSPLNRQMGKKPSWRSQWSCLPWFMGVGLG